MAHLFFSYAHADYARLERFHQLLQLRTERVAWIDKIGLVRDAEWVAMIRRAIEASYRVIFAVTEVFVKRPFIIDKEIPWAVERFNNTRQGKLIFVIQFDDVPLPAALTAPEVSEVVQVIDAVGRDWEQVIAEFRTVMPPEVESRQPFEVSWPRLRNFHGRDQMLIDLHTALIPADGKVGIKTQGMYGTGGIGKTQLAVEYAYRYRFFYPGGVYWLNAADDWQRQLVVIADHLGEVAEQQGSALRQSAQEGAARHWEMHDALLVWWGRDGSPAALYRAEAESTVLVPISATRCGIGDGAGRVLVIEVVNPPKQ